MKQLILIVDDNDCVRHCIAQMIETAGYETLEAKGAGEALEMLEQHPTIALLFTDIMMPVINGFVLADMVIQRWPHLRVIYASGLANLHDAGAQQGHRHGMMLAMPFRSEQLATALARTLSQDLQAA
jgi:CheY-like chemotaxis protein